MQINTGIKEPFYLQKTEAAREAYLANQKAALSLFFHYGERAYLFDDEETPYFLQHTAFRKIYLGMAALGIYYMRFYRIEFLGETFSGISHLWAFQGQGTEDEHKGFRSIGSVHEEVPRVSQTTTIYLPESGVVSMGVSAKLGCQGSSRESPRNLLADWPELSRPISAALFHALFDALYEIPIYIPHEGFDISKEKEKRLIRMSSFGLRLLDSKEELNVLYKIQMMGLRGHQERHPSDVRRRLLAYQRESAVWEDLESLFLEEEPPFERMNTFPPGNTDKVFAVRRDELL